MVHGIGTSLRLGQREDRGQWVALAALVTKIRHRAEDLDHPVGLWYYPYSPRNVLSHGKIGPSQESRAWVKTLHGSIHASCQPLRQGTNPPKNRG
jgi:hypothetical protein